jgi:hypothetical protein
MQNIADKTFCISTGALFQRAVTSGDRNDSECVGTNTESYLIFMAVKYGVRRKQRDKKKILGPKQNEVT